MNNARLITIIFLLFICRCARVQAATVAPDTNQFVLHDTLPDSTAAPEVSNNQDVAPDKNFKREKLIASVLAFPVPFGFCGLHRIYLGSEPWVPVAYLVTGGGGFGLLPLIDFIFIVTADEEEFKSYENNPHFFMWMK